MRRSHSPRRGADDRPLRHLGLATPEPDPLDPVYGGPRASHVLPQRPREEPRGPGEDRRVLPLPRAAGHGRRARGRVRPPPDRGAHPCRRPEGAGRGRPRAVQHRGGHAPHVVGGPPRVHPRGDPGDVRPRRHPGGGPSPAPPDLVRGTADAAAEGDPRPPREGPRAVAHGDVPREGPRTPQGDDEPPYPRARGQGRPCARAGPPGPEGPPRPGGTGDRAPPRGIPGAGGPSWPRSGSTSAAACPPSRSCPPAACRAFHEASAGDVRASVSGGTKILADATLLAAFQEGVEAWYFDPEPVRLPVLRGVRIHDVLGPAEPTGAPVPPSPLLEPYRVPLREPPKG